MEFLGGKIYPNATALNGTELAQSDHFSIKYESDHVIIN